MLEHPGNDNAPRWTEGERLHHLFEERCDALGEAAAVVTADATFTYRDIDARANRLARYLVGRGVKAGDRVALIFDKGVDTYVALLAVMKANAAYLPLDAGFPNDRLEFILEDAGAKRLLSMSAFREKLAALPVEKLFVDEAAVEIAKMPDARLTDAETGPADDQLAYIIYTSGTTGKPKGVAVHHASICNFVRVAAETYGYGPGDRVYQGMTIAFDFSVEELWVPLMAGATLVPAQAGANLVGDDLADFLLKNRITGMCCVPTLLATIEKDLPDLRLLLLSGEACPQHLVTRWHRSGRRILNVYGPTEATVTATMTEVTPDKAVTIGGPLPTYTIVILDPEEPALVAEGESGEIAIGGIGLAEGYLNRPELTGQKFIPDFLGLPHNPSKRIYRTGDLGRVNADGDIEYQGRIDTQVKVRGYRIELTEIESLLMEFPQVAQAVVSTFEPEPGALELVAYYSLNKGADEISPEEMCKSLRERLPCYMVPAYFEKLAVVPMTTSHKADRKNLPAPTGGRLTGANDNYVAPRTATETILAEALARALKIDRVSVKDDFFRDLGAHSLLMARFCSNIRQNSGFADISMRDVYMHRTIENLAAKLGVAEPVESAPEMREEIRVASDLEYYGCGALQALTYVAFGALWFWTLATGVKWTYAAVDDLGTLYLRATAFGLLMFFGFTALPIVAKWLLIGRFKAESFPIWSLRYFRFWLVKGLIRSAPVSIFGGTPLYNLYLRLLGAKIGKNAVIKSRFVPVTVDLFTVGEGAMLNKDSVIVGYKAEANRIHIGPVTIGANAHLGDSSVLDIDTAMGEDSELGHASSLQRGQRIPAGKRYHGSPAVETTTEFRTVEPMQCSSLRRWVYTAVFFVPGFALLAPAMLVVLFRLYPFLYANTSGAGVHILSPSMSLLTLAGEMAVLALALLVIGLVAGLLGIAVVPRLLRRFLVEDRTYVLYGVHYFLAQVISGASNSRFFNVMFGDSSYIVHYLKWTGWNLNRIEQTGSNFGTGQKHDFPFLCDIGTGTIVSDGLAMSNAKMSSSSFKLSKVTIGEQNFLGNNIHFPAGAATGANVLFGTKVMVPIDGPMREDVGLLGSPCFEIPRAVETERRFAVYADPKLRAERIAKKNFFNIKTMGYFLLSAWTMLFLGLFGTYLAILHYPEHGFATLGVLGAAMTATGLGYYTFAEWASIGFRRLEPQTVSIYDDYFWRHERYWKFYDSPIHALFKGTPFKNVVSRMMGVKVGRKVFDDGCHFVEKSMVEIGDNANLNEACVLQGHSLEEGVFKSDRIEIGAGSTIGAAAFVHYGVTVGESVVLDPDSFLMKGERPDPNSVWQGNPAKAIVRRKAAVEAAAAPLEDAAELEQAA